MGWMGWDGDMVDTTVDVCATNTTMHMQNALVVVVVYSSRLHACLDSERDSEKELDCATSDK